MTGLRHVVLLTLRDDTTEAQLHAILDGLSGLPAAIPQIAHYEFGADAGLAEGNATIAVVGDFASTADYEVYRDHPAHQAVIAEHIRPVLTGRTAVQHERRDP